MGVSFEGLWVQAIAVLGKPCLLAFLRLRWAYMGSAIPTSGGLYNIVLVCTFVELQATICQQKLDASYCGIQ